MSARFLFGLISQSWYAGRGEEKAKEVELGGRGEPEKKHRTPFRHMATADVYLRLLLTIVGYGLPEDWRPSSTLSTFPNHSSSLPAGITALVANHLLKVESNR